MARLPYLEPDQVAPEYRDMLKRNTNLHKLMVNSPDMAGLQRHRQLHPLQEQARPAPARARHPAGWLAGALGVRVHPPRQDRQGIRRYRRGHPGLIAETEGKPSKLEPLTKAILKGAREMTRDIGMSDATFAEIKQDLSNEHMTDLVLTIAYYCAVVRVLATMKIDNEPYYKEVLQQYPIPGVS